MKKLRLGSAAMFAAMAVSAGTFDAAVWRGDTLGLALLGLPTSQWVVGTHRGRVRISFFTHAF